MSPELLKTFDALCADARTQWGDGPWSSEPDRIEWRAYGLPCLMSRHPVMGHWCGYVGVPPGHPEHGKSDEEVRASAHGGINYAKKCAGFICHVAQPGESDDVWWFGFDCAHAGDVSPSTQAAFQRAGSKQLYPGESYKTVDYVRAEVEKLAEQLSKLGGSERP